ncbi:hypothetical protein [Rhizobium sp. BK376]|uniref:hypothetical protein n=1 Tax=Rhizobium sp. BK376 TaxID=2512149 RepID=UPI0010505807|nr:hypothetical protein [Rhizobium sp. BK376]
MSLPYDPQNKSMAVYALAVSGFAMWVLGTIANGIAGLSIENKQAECANSWTSTTLIWLAVGFVSLATHMGIGYLYFRSNGEGPYGPLPKPRSRKKPERKRLVPYVSNLSMFAVVIFPAMFILMHFNC